MGRGGGSNAAKGGGGGGGSAAPAPAAPAPAAAAGPVKPRTVETTGGVAVSTLTKDQEAALVFYAGSGYGHINALARGEPISVNVFSTQLKTAAIDKVIAKGTLVEAKTLFRGTETTFFEGVKVGSVFRDKGFLSTTADGAVAKKFAGDRPTAAILRIKAPAGIKAADVSHHVAGSNESEILLGRNTGLKLVRVSQVKGVTYYDVKVVN